MWKAKSKIALPFILGFLMVVVMACFSDARAANELPKKNVKAVDIVPQTDNEDVAVEGAKSEPETAVADPAELKSEAKPKAPEEKNSRGRKKKTEKPNVQDKDESGDTYNFYFQKTPGGNSVDQRKGQQKVEPRQTDEFDHGTKNTTPARKKFEPTDFDLYIGLFESPQSTGTGLYAGAEYHPSRSLGFAFGLMSMRYSSAGNSSSSFSASGSADTSQTGNASGGMLALTLSPVSTGTLRISGLVGVMGVSDTTTNSVHTFGAGGSNDTSDSTSKFSVLPVFGAEGTYYVSQLFGIQGRLMAPTDFKFAQIGIGASFRF